MLSGVAYNTYLTIITFWSWWWQVDNKQDELALIVLTVSVPILVLVFYKWTILYSTNVRLPPGPYGLPVVGYLPFLRSNLHKRFTEMAHFYGPIFSFRLGTKLHVVVNSIDLVKVLTRDLDHTFANRNPTITAKILTYDGRDIAWSNNNKNWRDMRKLLATQVLSKANLNTCESFRTCEVRKTVNHVYTKIGTKINISNIVFKTEVNVVTSMLWGGSQISGEGTDSSYFGDGFQEIVIKIMKLLEINISDFLPFLSWFDLQGRKKDMEKHFEFVDGIFDNIIDDRIKANSSKTEEGGKKDFLQILLELKDQKDGQISFNINHIKALLLDVVLAATDTTSTMVEWVMATLLYYPDVMRKVQEELTTVIGMKNIIEESHLPKLTYLDAVVKETFRLHPPLPLLIQRVPDESCKVGGYIIPKDSTFYINVWAIHYDPNNWTDPLEFKPERFLNDKWDYNGNNFKFLPFGSGRRKCAGIQLGGKMLMYILASLLHSFEWSLPKAEELDFSDEFGAVTRKRNPLIAIPFQRLHASLYMV